MDRRTRCSPKVRERAVRMVFEHEGEYFSQWSAIVSIAQKFGCTAETLRRWVRLVETGRGRRAGLSSAEHERLKELERENRNLRRANDILRTAPAYLPRLSPTADADDGSIHRRAQRSFWRRADLCDSVDRPIDVLRTPGSTARSTRRGPRPMRDEALSAQLRREWEETFGVYSARKVWQQRNRKGHPVARCKVERLMRGLGLLGQMRGPRVKATIPEAQRDRTRDQVNRTFTVSRPNALWVADLSHVATCRRLVYVAFAIDAFARRIVGWRLSNSLRSDLALDALKQALYDRHIDPSQRLIHHSDRGVQRGFKISSQHFDIEMMRWLLLD